MTLNWDFVWIIIFIWLLIPIIKLRQIESLRVKLLNDIQKQRGSRVVSLIHRQEAVSFLGIPVSKHINIEDSEQILRAIRLTPDHIPIDLILHTPGGLVLAAEQIAHAIQRHPAKVTVLVPHYAMSGGTLLALAADEIILDENAVLGPIDPQLGSYPAASILKILEQKPISHVQDSTLIMADIAEKAIKQVRNTVYNILRDGLEEEKAKKLAAILTEGRWTHDYPITCEELKELGLNVSVGLPQEVYKLMDLYPQCSQRRPSVQYIPLPAEKKEGKYRDFPFD